MTVKTSVRLTGSIIISALTILLIQGCFMFKKASAQRLYLAYNIWFEAPERADDLNYRKGIMIPAGVEIVDLQMFVNYNYFTFRELAGKSKIRFQFNPLNHQNISMLEFADRMFTPLTLKQMTQGFTEAEIRCIRSGDVLKGVSKQAVLITYGYPQDNLNSSTDNNKWIYRLNEFETQVLKFNDGGFLESISIK